MEADNAGLAADVQWPQAYQSSTLTLFHDALACNHGNFLPMPTPPEPIG